MAIKIEADLITIELIRDLARRSAGIILPKFHFFTAYWECDIFHVTKNKMTIEYEIKISKSDFKADFKKSSKIWKGKEIGYQITAKHDLIIKGQRTNRFYFVIPEEFVEDSELMQLIPERYGVITFKKVLREMYLPYHTFKYYRQAGLLHTNKLTDKKIDKIKDIAISKLNFLYDKLIWQDISRYYLRKKRH